MSKITNKKFSVLMSVYYKEKPEYLRESINSMLNQTTKPDEIVLVKDGPLTEDLDNVINEFKDNEILIIVELKENLGLGKALNIGLKVCKNELIARMDTDDISLPNRCEKQLEQFLIDDSISAIGTTVAEFIDDPGNVVTYKKVKENHKDIKVQMKYRNQMNHPSVMYKKSDVIKAGSYKHLPYNEDYYLWIRMLKHGCKFEIGSMSSVGVRFYRIVLHY